MREHLDRQKNFGNNQIKSPAEIYPGMIVVHHYAGGSQRYRIVSGVLGEDKKMFIEVLEGKITKKLSLSDCGIEPYYHKDGQIIGWNSSNWLEDTGAKVSV